MKNFLRNYFTIFFIIKAFAIAFSLSAFIYLDYFSLHVKFINSFFAVFGFYLLLKANKYELFWSGFFIGLFWFYWIALSFRYYDLTYLIPLVICGIAFIYGIIFRIIGIFEKRVCIKVVLLFLLSFFSPFGFNWLKPELSLLDSYFNPEILTYALFLGAITLMIKAKKEYKLLAVVPLFLSTLHTTFIPEKEPLKIKLASLNIPQEIRWKKKFQHSIISKNYNEIKKAIDENYDIFILPESAFPLYLNLDEENLKKLENLSKKIVIITGALTYDKGNFYNSNYHFENGKLKEIAHKVILVPFGEEVPLPKFFTKIVNNIFFNGANDYTKSKQPQDFNIKGEKFRNAICFEATRDEIYEENPKKLIATSNNAWFTPSIEPTLQNLLLRLYAKKYKTIIYHSANGGISSIIKP